MGRRTVGRTFKQALTLVGARMPEKPLHGLHMALNYMRLGRWAQDEQFAFGPRHPDRYGVYDAVMERVRNQRVLYLEFGVYQGESMRYWSKGLQHPEAVLHGFDSFEGLPEDFCVGGGYKKGTFSTGGKLPEIDDRRVDFFKGWFEDTLPHYTVPDHEVLVLSMDADLYSSTIYVLRHFRSLIKPGTFIYFDDMSRPDHEPKAFSEFMAETGLRFKGVSADLSLNNAAFECIP